MVSTEDWLERQLVCFEVVPLGLVLGGKDGRLSLELCVSNDESTRHVHQYRMRMH